MYCPLNMLKPLNKCAYTRYMISHGYYDVFDPYPYAYVGLFAYIGVVQLNPLPIYDIVGPMCITYGLSLTTFDIYDR